MHKQKKFNHHSNSLPKFAQKPTKVYVWSEEHFAEMYPQPPDIITSSTFITIGLNYNGILIKVKIPSNVPNKHLPYIFHKQIYTYLLNMHDKNPLLKTSKVVGFQSVDGDILLDYKIAIGEGNLTRKISFNCILYFDDADAKLRKYKICKCLATGGFSKVYLVRSLRDGQFYAMKVMLKKFINSTQKESIIENQKNICAQLNHPFIVKLNHAFETHNFVCFVFDYCSGGQLFYHLKKIKRMNEENARFYFIEILYGLLYLHQQKIIYRDLKPENLLINYDGHIKIADFGLSKANMQEKQLTYSFCGSTEYMPPEMILRQGHSYGVDFYTLGALLYELVTGLPPFYSKDEEQIQYSIINEELTFPDHVNLSEQLKNLLVGLLNKNQKLRIGSMKGLKQILFHPWVGRMNSEVILSKKLEPPYIPSIQQFNFDENQLGDDEQEFTQTLLNQHLIGKNKEKLVYEDFDFYNQSHLKPEIQAIFNLYEAQNKIGQIKKSQNTEKIKKQMKKCNSLKNLKAHNSVDMAKARSPLKRQASSPYLRSSATTKNLKTSMKKSFTSNPQDKTLKTMVRNSNILPNQRSLSKKKLKDISTYMNILNNNDKSLMGQSSNKKLKPNNSHYNQKQNPVLKAKTKKPTGNPLLKKKALIYNYIDNISYNS